MSDYIPIPEPVTWLLAKPAEHGGMSYPSVTLRAPTAGEVLKATAVRGATGMDVTLRLIEAVSIERVPYDVLKTLSAYQIMQMSDYLDLFTGVPPPDPLAAWQAARRAQAAAAADGATPASPTDG